MKWALVVVDMQRDFCEGGQLAVRDTISLLAPLRFTIERTRERGILIVFTQDWHPANHKSFIINGGRWPVHCVCSSSGADLEPSLKVDPVDLVIRKGQLIDQQGYSAFETDILGKQLHLRGIDALAIAGIATDFCVRATAMDAVKLGFKTELLVDLTRPVDPTNTLQLLAEMNNAGITLTQSHDWLLHSARDVDPLVL